jgi:predicted phage terminase large subunit-like protein
LQTIISCDSAYKTGAENDYTVLLVIGEGTPRNPGYYILHMTRDRFEFPELKRQAIALCKLWSPNYLLCEDKVSGTSLIQELRAETNLPVLPYKVSADKLTRAHAVSPLCESSRVFLPAHAHWLSNFISEVTSFPAGAHDDITDSLTMGLGYLREHAWQKPELITIHGTGSWSLSAQRDARANRLYGTAEYWDNQEDGLVPSNSAGIQLVKSPRWRGIENL